MKLNFKQIQTILEPHQSFLQNTYHVEKIGIFGSTALDKNTDISDVDILVKFSEPIGFFKYIELEDYLSKALGKKADLVTQKALKSAIKQEILQQVLYV